MASPTTKHKSPIKERKSPNEKSDVPINNEQNGDNIPTSRDPSIAASSPPPAPTKHDKDMQNEKLAATHTDGKEADDDETRPERRVKPTMIDKAFQEQYKIEKETVQDLVVENVRLDKRVKRLTEQILELEDRTMDLEEELNKSRNQNDNLVSRINALETEMKIYKKDEDIDVSADIGENTVALSKDAYEQKIADLQLRLKRIARDEREQNLRLDELQVELVETRSYVASLEGHIGEDDVKVLRKTHDKVKNKEDNYRMEERTNVVEHKSVHKSSVCVIL